jgi:hypothetical protein
MVGLTNGKIARLPLQKNLAESTSRMRAEAGLELNYVEVFPCIRPMFLVISRVLPPAPREAANESPSCKFIIRCTPGRRTSAS